MNNLKRIVFCGLLILPWTAGAIDLAKDFSFDGVLLDDAGTPVPGPVSLKFQIWDHSGSLCLLFQEMQSGVAVGSDGSFSVKVGQGTRASASVDGGYLWRKIFQNNATIPDGPNCNSGYTPAANDSRKLRIYVNNGANPLAPDFSMSPVPMATVAESLQGLVPSDFLNISGGTMLGPLRVGNANTIQFAELSSNGSNSVSLKSPDNLAANQVMTLPGNAGSAGHVLSTDGSGILSWVAPSGGGGGSVTSVSAGAGLSGGTITSSGTISLPSLGTAGTYSKVTVDSYGRVSSGVSSLAEADVPVLNTAGKVSGSSINAGTIGGSAAVNISGNIQTSGNVQTSGMSANTISTGSGSASTPSLNFGGGDGFFSPAANTIGLAISSVEKLRIDPSGNLGIGVTNPSAKLQVTGSTYSSSFGAPTTSPSSPAYSVGGATGATSNTGMFSPGGTSLGFSVAGAKALVLNYAASAVNYVSMLQAPSGSGAVIGSDGSDTNVNLSLIPKGTGKVGIKTASPGVGLDAGQITDAIRIPTGTTAQRPVSPQDGDMRYNTTTSKFEVYQNSSWIDMIADTPGGLQIFNADDTFVIPSGITKVKVIVIGGGAGGCNGGGMCSTAQGGSGASGYGIVSNLVPGSSVTITVGAGGSQATVGGAGGSTSFGSFVIAGGGAGATSSGSGSPGSMSGSASLISVPTMAATYGGGNGGMSSSGSSGKIIVEW